MRYLSLYEGQLLNESLDVFPTRKHTIYIFLFNDNQICFVDKYAFHNYQKVKAGYSHPTIEQRDFMRQISAGVEVPSLVKKKKLRELIKKYQKKEITSNEFKKGTKCHDTSPLL